MNSINNCQIKCKITYIFFFNFFFFKNLLCQINDNYSSGDLDSADYFLDVKDNNNLYLTITSSKKIYAGIPPTLKSTFEANINSYSSIATYNDNFILVACLEDSLLSKININSGDNEILLNYFGNLVKPEFICSLVINIDKIYIAISQPSTSGVGKLEHKIIKVDIKNNENLEIDDSSSPEILEIPNDYPPTSFTHQILCETLITKDTSENKLICIYEDVSARYPNLYDLYAIIIKEDFTKEKTLNLLTNDKQMSMKLYKLNQYYFRIVLNAAIFDIYLIYENNEIIRKRENTNLEIIKDAESDLFDYNKNYIVKISKKEKYIGNNLIILPVFEIHYNYSNDYYEIYDKNWTDITKILNYYDEKNDYYLCVFQVPGQIKYFTFHNNIKIFDIKQYAKTLKITSNTAQEYNVSQIIESEQNFGLLEQYSCNEIKFFNEYHKTYYPNLEVKFEKISQILTTDSTNNSWKIYGFCFRDNQLTSSREFILSKTQLHVQTCSFQCLSCPDDYYICDGCREGYAKLNSVNTDSNCYPIDQLIAGFIYDPDTKNFEPCFPSCMFCSTKGESSTRGEHNCEFCKEGYYPSYQHKGNCYKINEEEIALDKYVENIDDESFTLISCSTLDKSFKIKTTGECVDECPQDTIYYNYIYTNYFNFTEQDYLVKVQQYNKTNGAIFKYKFKNICYEECPLNSVSNQNNECQCQCEHGWHKDEISGNINCYDKDYCLNSEYRYYHDNTKECKQTGCDEGYHQFNFQCYIDGCPPGTTASTSNSNNCESTSDYCYINEHFQTVCNGTAFQEYTYQYNNTNQYLKSCDDSLIYTTLSKKTYLYNEICYLECPELLKEDDENNKCIQEYNGEEDIIEPISYQNTEEVENCNGKILVVDNNECVKTIDICINKKYKIFNNDCYKNGCPSNTNLDGDNTTCICSFYYYNNTKESQLICFDQLEKCESRNYLYSSPDTLECFETLEECFVKNYLLYFNSNCFKGKCPYGKIIFNNIVNDTIKNDISSILDINKNLENKICICNNMLSYNYLRQNNYNGTQTCVLDRLEIFEEKCIKEEYPKEYIENSNNCPVIYQDSCVKFPPEETCISQRNSHLVCLVEVKLDMKVFNFICFEDFLEIEKNIVNISNSNAPINTSPGISIYIYYNQSSVDEVFKVYTNLSVLYLNDCENKIKEEYKLAPDEKLYILGIDSPNIFNKSPVTVYNYEIFLENGTQIKDLSICENTTITLSSAIINDKLVHYEEAVHFSSYGYDIYNINDKFYTSYCSPASINNNDITLDDRFRYFYPSNISLCNDSCTYSYINLTFKRIYCSCYPYKYQKNETEEKQESYSNYLLSLINYKIIACYKLLYDIKNYYYNFGFFIGVLVLIFCFCEFLVFMKFGINLINKQIFDNMPNDIIYKENESNERVNTLKNNINKKPKQKQKIRLSKKKSKDAMVLINSKNNLNKSPLISNPIKKINIFNMNKNIASSEGIVPDIFDNNVKKRTYSVKVSKKKKIKKGRKITFNQKNDTSILKSHNDEKKSCVQGGEKSNISILKVSPLSKNHSDFNYNKISKIEMFEIDPLIHYNNYIIIDDNSVDKKEMNNVPYTQALRIDKRQFWDMYQSILFNEINAINIFYYKNEYVHLSLTTSIYAFSELLDFTINCFIYSDDEVSEKYHNNGSLTMVTSLTLSFLSNILSNIIVFIISKLTNFSEILDILIKDVRDQEIYRWNIVRITKYTRIKLLIFYSIQFIFLICMIYYLFLFCAVYHNSQISIALNYFYGVLESFAISLLLAFITTILRYISLKFKISRLYNISKYCYQHF